ncbi:MAG: aldehyde dehydrogenase family protein [Bryobacter sp.]|nr:aldehyde dehydrogenase family protein [Bryobacter sp.]
MKPLQISCPYDGQIVGELAPTRPEELDGIFTRAQAGARQMRQWTRAERSALLRRAAQGMEARREELARTLALESGKPLREARTEVERALSTVLFSAEEANRLAGEEVPVDAAPVGAGRLAMTLREPRGVIAAITPFNFPLNLSLHKVAPALGAGNAVIHKPASRTPMVALAVREIFLAAGCPPEAWQIVLGPGSEIGEALLASPVINMLTFTGSAAVGYGLRARAATKRVTLELGNNSAVVVRADADFELALDSCVRGAYSNSGQTCISVQRIYVETPLAEAFAQAFAEKARRLARGHPLSESTEISSLIAPGEAERVEDWVGEAESAGASVIERGSRDAARLGPTVLWNAPAAAKVMAEEVFGPVATIVPVADLDAALAEVNASRFGLQAAIFTRDLDAAWRFARQAYCGGVLINDPTTFRADHMPYGGVKESGTGREGPRYAMEEMTELKLVSWRVSS